MTAGAGHRVAISAHRGGGERAPIGTMAAYADALEAGCDYVEFDVRKTRDHELVAYHDPRAERRGIRPGEMTRSALEAAVGGQLLDIRELLGLIAGKTRAHVDVKEPGFAEDIVGLAVDVMGAANIVVTGVDDVIMPIKKHFPDVRTALSLGRGWRDVPVTRIVRTRWTELHPLQRIRACGADAVAVHYRLARLGVLDTCRRHGIGTMVWTVNDPVMIRSHVIDERIDVLITERPRLAMEIRGR